MPFSDLSYLLETLKLDAAQLTLVDGNHLKSSYYPPFSPAGHVIVFDILPGEQAKKIEYLLSKIYPLDHFCFGFVPSDQPGSDWGQPSKIPIHAIGGINSKIDLYIPPALPDSSLESFQNLIAHLRSPQGCPWDREQTHQSLRPNLLEETYEVLNTLDEQDSADLMEELGDLLLQIVLHSQIANESGEFNLSQVIQGIYKKIMYRHPHVFKDEKIEDAKGVIRKWEELKSVERLENGRNKDQGILESIPRNMPALSLAQEYQKRAARVGFDWSEIQPVMDKVNEELIELNIASTQMRKEEELGDLLFAVVNLARWLNVDAESALRKMTSRFYSRFTFIEQQAGKMGKKLQNMTLKEMDSFWELAKEQGL